MDSTDGRHACHHAKTEKAAVPDDKRSGHRFCECDLDVPEPLFWKSRARRECFNALAVAFERFALDADCLDLRA